MESIKETKITLMTVTVSIATLVSLFAATIIITPQQADAIPKYDTGANDPNPAADVTSGKTDQSLQQDDPGNTGQPSPTTPTVPTNCAMNTIESLESFLGCLGAK
jgi:hypothetical protein